MKKICFISHNATRTGAPIVLYEFVKWLKEQHNHSIEVWFIEGGEMLPDFEALCDCTLLPSTVVKGLWKRGARKLFKQNPVTKQLKGLSAFDLIFFNTAASLKIIPLLPKDVKGNYVLWLHEQPFSINSWYKEQFTKENLSIFTQIFAVSSQTKTWLEKQMGVDAGKVAVVYPFIDTGALLQEAAKLPLTHEKATSAFIVGGCGLQDWRKGPDLFLQAAKQLFQQYPEINIEFVWVGAESGMTAGLQYELELLQLKGKVVFTGATKNTSAWFSKFDVFLLTSREDPFPLVVLEAAAAAKPVICFDGIGDITKLAGIIPENVIPYGNVDVMAERVLMYYEKKGQTDIDGAILKREVHQYGVEIIAPQLYSKLL